VCALPTGTVHQLGDQNTDVSLTKAATTLIAGLYFGINLQYAKQMFVRRVVRKSQHDEAAYMCTKGLPAYQLHACFEFNYTQV
jgi:hypothetical protein